MALLKICASPNASLACVGSRNKHGKTEQPKTEGIVSPNSTIYCNASSTDLNM